MVLNVDQNWSKSQLFLLETELYRAEKVVAMHCVTSTKFVHIMTLNQN